MTEVRGKTNLILRELIKTLIKYSREHNAKLWRVIAEDLSRAARTRRAVNISRINRCTNPGDFIVVPGKVLGAGKLNHPVVVAALSFSKTAIEKIGAAGGRAINIYELLREKPDGSGVRIVG
ncbi:MAG: 50S ribosomal protein L18e [Desulfurococcaceae archaeon]